MSTLVSDLRVGWRALRHRPLWSLAVVIILGLGIGACTTVFSVVNAVMLQPLPFKDPDRLVRLWESQPGTGAQAPASALNFRDWQVATSFESLEACELATYNLSGASEPERLAAAAITPGLLRTLGIRPLLGREFFPEEAKAGATKVVLMGHGLWLRRFGGQASVLGSTVSLNDVGHTVVGILPPGFQFPAGRELYVPLCLDPAWQPWRGDRAHRNLAVFGRLRAKVTLEAASADLKRVAEALERTDAANRGWGVQLRTFYDWMVPRDLRLGLLVLGAAVSLILLLACANVANLLAARAMARSREMGIRAALGASRAQLIRQLLTEGLMLSLLGGTSGLVCAFTATRWIAASPARDLPRLAAMQMDGTTLVFCLTISLLTGLGFGVLPTWWASRRNLVASLSGQVPRGRRSMGRFLASAQVALSLAILVGAGLLVRSYLKTQAHSYGFNPEHVLTFQLNLPEARYNAEKRLAFYRELLARLRTLPGVEDATAATQPPLPAAEWTLETRDESAERPVVAEVRAVTSRYFLTFGIPLSEGRDFQPADEKGDGLNLIISRALARQLWPGQSALGRRLRPGPQNPAGTVVGVAEDVQGLRDSHAKPVVYLPYSHLGMPAMTLMVRTSGDPSSLHQAIRRQVQSLDGALPIYGVKTMETILGSATSGLRFQSSLLTLFGLLGLLLAFSGVYALMDALTLQREREVGVRLAVGATPLRILGMLLRQGMGQVLIGLGIGWIGALALSQSLSGLLYHVSTQDPITYVSAAATLAGAGLLACLLAARRAARQNPVAILKG